MEGVQPLGVRKGGCLEGVVTLLEEGDGGSLLVGLFSGGVLVPGPLWLLFPYGEGALYMETDEGGQSSLSRALFTGDSITFLYPDMKTSLVGKFVAATMLESGVCLIK